MPNESKNKRKSNNGKCGKNIVMSYHWDIRNFARDVKNNVNEQERRQFRKEQDNIRERRYPS